MNFKNMKIEINEVQPLDEVVAELGKRGYGKVGWIGYRNPSLITTNTKGFYTDHAISFWSCFGDFPLTTLAELKEIQCKI